MHATHISHASQRAAERFGIPSRTLVDAVSMIRSGEATFVRARGGREIWSVEISGRELPVVYDPAGKYIVTVLPKFALREIHRQIKKKKKSHERNLTRV